eukprot:4756613-Amphidinium_carterae.2
MLRSICQKKQSFATCIHAHAGQAGQRRPTCLHGSPKTPSMATHIVSSQPRQSQLTSLAKTILLSIFSCLRQLTPGTSCKRCQLPMRMLQSRNRSCAGLGHIDSNETPPVRRDCACGLVVAGKVELSKREGHQPCPFHIRAPSRALALCSGPIGTPLVLPLFRTSNKQHHTHCHCAALYYLLMRL